MTNPIITAFAQPEILEGYDHIAHAILVTVDGKTVGSVKPERDGYHEMGYAFGYRGVTRGQDGVTPIGPAFDPERMKRRLISVMFNGDRVAFEKARLVRVKKNSVPRYN